MIGIIVIFFFSIPLLVYNNLPFFAGLSFFTHILRAYTQLCKVSSNGLIRLGGDALTRHMDKLERTGRFLCTPKNFVCGVYKNILFGRRMK